MRRSMIFITKWYMQAENTMGLCPVDPLSCAIKKSEYQRSLLACTAKSTAKGTTKKSTFEGLLDYFLCLSFATIRIVR